LDSPQDTLTQPEPRGCGGARDLFRELNQMRGTAPTSDSDSQVIWQILGHRPLIHQIPTGWNVNHAPGWLREPCSVMDKRHQVQTKDRNDNGTNGKGWGSRNSRSQAQTQSHSRREGVKEHEDSALTPAHTGEQSPQSSTLMPSHGSTTPPYICPHTLYVRIWSLPPICRNDENVSSGMPWEYQLCWFKTILKTCETAAPTLK
jgi:hypothetical protein